MCRKHLIIWGFQILVLINLFSVVAFAEGNFSDDYPGEGDNITIYVSDTMVAQAARCYHHVYGNFPDRWADVVNSGIAEYDLVGFHMQPIDPDNQSLDFPGDVYYENNLGRAVVHKMGHDGKPSRVTLKITNTYEDKLTRMGELIELSAEQQTRVDEIINDEDQLIQFAILGNVSRSLSLFNTIHERNPADLDEFIESGLSPISYDTINPVTGVPFKFDGSPGDVFLEFNEGHVLFTHVDEKGVRLPSFDYYF